MPVINEIDNTRCTTPPPAYESIYPDELTALSDQITVDAISFSNLKH